MKYKYYKCLLYPDYKKIGQQQCIYRNIKESNDLYLLQTKFYDGRTNNKFIVGHTNWTIDEFEKSIHIIKEINYDEMLFLMI